MAINHITIDGLIEAEPTTQKWRHLDNAIIIIVRHATRRQPDERSGHLVLSIADPGTDQGQGLLKARLTKQQYIVLGGTYYGTTSVYSGDREENAATILISQWEKDKTLHSTRTPRIFTQPSSGTRSRSHPTHRVPGLTEDE